MAHIDEKVIDTMSGADALLWTIGRDPVMRPTMVAVMMLDRAPRWKGVQSRLAALTKIVPRLRSHAVMRPVIRGRPQFVEDGRFDLGMHLRRMTLSPHGTLRDVLDMVQVMATTGFDPALPLWEAVVVEGVDGDGAALIVKLHHALIDGVGGLAALMHLLDGQRRGGVAVAPVATPSPGKTPLDRLKCLPSPRQIIDTALDVAVHPAKPIRQLLSTNVSVARLLAPARKPISTLMTERSFRRHVEVLDVEWDALQQAARTLGGTVNDVFVASVVRGLTRYHERHGTVVGGLRALMPVNVRGGNDAIAGNHFVPARFTIAVHVEASDCFAEVRRITSSWKHAPGLAVSDVLANGLSLLPATVAMAMWSSMLKGDDFCVTNIPGPPFETYFAGARVERIYAFAPPSGAALNVSLISLPNRACVGITVDAAAIPDSSTLVECIEDGFKEMCRLDSLVPEETP